MADPTEPKDATKNDGEFAGRWIAELESAEKATQAWDRRSKKIIKLYKDERGDNRGASTRRRFNILWSNIQTIGPAIYARTPQAVVSRRFKDDDPLGRVVSEVLERALNYSLEEYDFDQRLVACRQDYLLTGRGTAWVRYEPVIETQGASNDGAEPMEKVTYERVPCDYVPYEDFLHNVARNWGEVRWIARKAYMSRDALVKRFGDKIGRAVPLDFGPKANSSGDEKRDEQVKRAVIYEIWDKDSKKAIWISRSFTEQALDVRDDPLGLTEFFPTPRPVFATLGPDSLIPVPDYVLYQDQAEEIDDLTDRICKLIDALRMVGFYAGDEKAAVQSVFAPSNENTLIPIDTWTAFAEKGGVKGLIEWVPIDMVEQALKGCFEARRQLIEDVYQITGISDIVRGDSDPGETATAARLKGQWGSLRVRDRQKEMARFARDIIRIQGEIIAEKFGADTLAKMTGVKLFATAQEKQAAQQAAQIQAQMAQMAQQGGQAPAKPDERLGRPTWEEVKAVLADDAQRQFRVEIETDSTVDPDDAEEKAAAVEFIETIATLIGQAGPIVQQAPPLGQLVGESVKFLTRRYRIGREMEETIDQTMAALANMPPPAAQQQGDPNAPKVAQLELQTEQIKQQGQLQGKQMDAQMQAQQQPLDVAELQLKQQLAMRDPNPQVAA
jgi:hypothetical protein